MVATSPSDAAGASNASPAADAAAAAQPSSVSSQTATAGKAAGAAEAREGAHADTAATGSKSKRKRRKGQQQQVADANGHTSEPVQASSGEAASGGAFMPGLGKTALHGPASASGRAPMPAPSLGDGVKLASAQPNGSETAADAASLAASRRDGSSSAQREPSVVADSKPGEQTSPRDSSKRKSVRFHLRDNLFFEPGGQVPPAAVRTPPKARPKVRHAAAVLRSATMHCVLPRRGPWSQ